MGRSPLAAGGSISWNREVFTFRVVASRLHDESTVGRVAARYVSLLEHLGGRQSADPDAPVALVATGGTEREVLEAWRRGGWGVPRVLVAHPGHNSLPAALEALAALRQHGGRGAIVFLDGAEDPGGSAKLGHLVGDLEVWRRLHQIRLGLVGAPSDWLVASVPDPRTVRAAWGPEVVSVPIGDLVARHRLVTPSDGHPRGRPAGEVAAASGVTGALRSLAAEHELDAVTVRCFDLIGSLGTTGCLALSSLNDEGMVAGCEGDLVSAIGMLWLREMTGEVPWMANPARVAAGTLVLAHCTVPSTIVDEVRYDTHFESGIGVGIAGRFTPGPVTVLRIGATGLDALWVAEGEVVGAGDDAGLCRTQVTVQIARDAAEALVQAPLGNHLVMARGHHEPALRRYHDWLIRPKRLSG